MLPFNPLKLLIGLFVLFGATAAVAEQKVELGDWNVHYMAINSTFVSPQVAKQYGIVRSKYNGLINISVLDKNSQKAQQAIVSGEARNLLGVVKKLAFKEVKEGGAIYYLSPLSFSDQERYTITIYVNNGQTQQKFSFEHKFYAE